ncbi:FeoC-like transcriptional regulator [Janthinobacterium sp.]|uniref:FeoC-like transcriptional regulator n=1 Tax=Janthinobacterium sp. TaxID=1871054 RepID=UPI0026392401|nr:FeoC-like transcriptional regulator [Janthinobacterium sp.]
MLNSSQLVESRVAPRQGRQLQGRSKKSQLHIARIAQYIREQGQASAAQLSALLGLDAGTMSRYLRHMCGMGQIHLAQRHCTEPGRQRPALYALGEPDEEVDGWAELPPQVRRTACWPRGAARRDPLVAALFGPAQGQGGKPPSQMNDSKQAAKRSFFCRN